jgi:hypothetical protein
MKTNPAIAVFLLLLVACNDNPVEQKGETESSRDVKTICH